MAENTFDTIVIGGGPGGYVTAIRSAQLGMKTALLEKEHLGGVCLNWGCIPTKALLRTAEIYKNIQNAEDFGLSVSNISFDIKKIVARSRNVANQLTTGVSYLLKKNDVKVFEGHGKLAGNCRIVLENNDKIVDELSAQNIIIATGARAKGLPEIVPDGKSIWTYKEAMMPDKLPSSLLVIGSGAIGIEFASFYCTLGVVVTVVELLPNILPTEDAEISDLAQKSFESQGIKILTSSSVTSLKTEQSNIVVTINNNGQNLEQKFDKVILAVGIIGNVEDLGLNDTSIEVDKNHIKTDNWGATNEPGIYAIGDVTGPPWLAHKASHEGIICVEKIAGIPNVHALDTSNIPGCTYCHPQIASVGLTEAIALEKGYNIKVGRFPFKGNGKAIALGEPEGLVKTIFDAETGELLGAHMIGSEVTELIQGYSIAKSLETTEVELMQTIFPHPTLSEMIHESVLDAYDKIIHF